MNYPTDVRTIDNGTLHLSDQSSRNDTTTSPPPETAGMLLVANAKPSPLTMKNGWRILCFLVKIYCRNLRMLCNRQLHSERIVQTSRNFYDQVSAPRGGSASDMGC